MLALVARGTLAWHSRDLTRLRRLLMGNLACVALGVAAGLCHLGAVILFGLTIGCDRLVPRVFHLPTLSELLLLAKLDLAALVLREPLALGRRLVSLWLSECLGSRETVTVLCDVALSLVALGLCQRLWRLLQARLHS